MPVAIPLSQTLCISLFFSHLARRFYLKNGNPSFLPPPPRLYFFIVIFSCFLPPGPLNGRTVVRRACARARLLCPGFTHVISLTAHHTQPLISTGQMGGGGAGSWEPEQPKVHAAVLTTRPLSVRSLTSLCVPQCDPCLCTCRPRDTCRPVQLVPRKEGVSC